MKDERVAVITGGGTGIGAATARLFAGRGMSVVLVGRRREMLDQVAEGIRAGGGRAHVISADLAAPETPERIVAETLRVFGQLDVLVNNAATIIQHALPALRRSGDAAIVNISSVVGSVVKPGNTLYGMTKAAVEYLTRALAVELAPRKIRVNCLACGSVKTPIHLLWAGSLENAERDLVPRIPLGRMADPEEMAYWIYQLVAPETSFATGEIFHIDGGQALGAPE
jgi:meso-butanediol dehydrogenase/(S,S)-butanediol dehydrogenase/diacetyl reductase